MSDVEMSLDAVMQEARPPLYTAPPGLEVVFDDIHALIKRAWSGKPSERPTAQTFCDTLGQCLEGANDDDRIASSPWPPRKLSLTQDVASTIDSGFWTHSAQLLSFDSSPCSEQGIDLPLTSDEVNRVDVDGHTPLQKAIWERSKEHVESLLRRGAIVSEKELSLAKITDGEEIVYLLEQAEKEYKELHELTEDTNMIPAVEWQKVLIFGDYLAEGSYCPLHKAQWRYGEYARLDVAVKTIVCEDDDPNYGTLRESFESEREVLKLRHTNIIRAYLIKALTDEKTLGTGMYGDYKSGETKYSLVLEYMPGGNLDAVIDTGRCEEELGITDANYSYNVAQALSWMLQAAKGLAYMHENGVLHRDIAPSNMLLDASLRRLKLADFNLSCKYDSHADDSVNLVFRGTRSYIPPELDDMRDAHEKCPFAADIYSWALCCIETFTNSARRPPAIELLPRVLQQCHLDRATYDTFEQFMINAISAQPSQRPSANECVTILARWQNEHFPERLAFVQKHEVEESTERGWRHLSGNSRKDFAEERDSSEESDSIKHPQRETVRPSRKKRHPQQTRNGKPKEPELSTLQDERESTADAEGDYHTAPTSAVSNGATNIFSPNIFFSPTGGESGTALDPLPSQQNADAETTQLQRVAGNIDEVRKLIQDGDKTDAIRGVLHFAVKYNNCDVVDCILRCTNINPNDTDGEETLMHLAARSGCDYCISVLALHGADVNRKAKDGRTPLHVSFEHKHCVSVMTLLQYGANAIQHDAHGAQPIHYAATQGCERCVEVLLAKGAKINARTNAKTTPLLLAARHGHWRLIKGLLSKGAEFDAVDAEGNGALHLALVSNNRSCVNSLLRFVVAYKHNSAINHANQAGNTPLHIAAAHDFYDLVLLTEMPNIDLDARNAAGLSPLHVAVQHCNVKHLLHLINVGAAVASVDESGNNALHHLVDDKSFLCKENSLEQDIAWRQELCVLILLRRINPSAVNKRRQNVLHSAMNVWCDKHTGVIERLLDNDLIMLNWRDNENLTPLYIATQKQLHNLIRLLLRADADVNCQDGNDDTPLHYAVRNGYTTTVDTLLKGGASVKVLNNAKMTPLQLAEELNDAQIISMLVSAAREYEELDAFMKKALTLGPIGRANELEESATPNDNMTGVHSVPDSGIQCDQSDNKSTNDKGIMSKGDRNDNDADVEVAGGAGAVGGSGASGGGSGGNGGGHSAAHPTINGTGHSNEGGEAAVPGGNGGDPGGGGDPDNGDGGVEEDGYISSGDNASDDSTLNMSEQERATRRGQYFSRIMNALYAGIHREFEHITEGRVRFAESVHRCDFRLPEHLYAQRYLALKLMRPTPENWRQYVNEHHALSALRHRHIIRMYAFFESFQHALLVPGNALHIVTDYMPDGSLQTMFARGQCFSSNLYTLQWPMPGITRAFNLHYVVHIMKQAAKGIVYMHENGFAHCDVRPHNLLLCKKGYSLKICDFGMSGRPTAVPPHALQQSDAVEGYTPELKILDDLNLFFDDVYCLGLCLYFGLTKKDPVAYNRLNHSGPLTVGENDLRYDYDIHSHAYILRPSYFGLEPLTALLQDTINKSASERPTAEVFCNKLRQWLAAHSNGEPLWIEQPSSPENVVPQLLAPDAMDAEGIMDEYMEH